MAPLEGLCSPTEAWLFYYGWSRIYERMQPFFTSPEMREAGLDMAEVSGSLDVLDVGAGTGTLSQQVAARIGGSKRLSMVDQSAQMLNQAKAKSTLSDGRFELADCNEALPFEDDAFDRVVSSGVFYYFPDPVQALREQLRVVRPGGKVLVMGSLAPKPFLVRVLAQTFNRFPTEEQYASWFAEAGCADVQWKHVSNPWNTQQYAIAIMGTKPADFKSKSSASAGRNTKQQPQPSSLGRTLRRLAYLPVALARFGVAVAAFSIVGPLQIANAAIAMRRMRSSAV